MKTICSMSPEPNQKVAPRTWRKSRTERTQIMPRRNLASALMSLHWKGAQPLGRAALEGELVRLEPVDVARHAGELFAAQSGAPGSWEYLPYGPFENEAAFQACVTERGATTDQRFYAILHMSSGRD